MNQIRQSLSSRDHSSATPCMGLTSMLRTACANALMYSPLLQQKECSNGNYDYANHEYLIATQFGCSVICFYSLVGLDITQTLYLVLHDLVDLPINLAVVTVVAPHRDAPHDQP